jgi:hypothetical protein
MCEIHYYIMQTTVKPASHTDHSRLNTLGDIAW